MTTGATGLSGIAGRYATALYDLAEEAKALDAVADDLRSVKAMLEASGDLMRLIRSPLIDRARQAAAMQAVLETAGTGDLVRRFIAVVARNRRLFALPAMIDAYLGLLAARRGEVVAEVTSAHPLAEEHLARLTQALRRVVGGKVSVDLKVDPGIIGGLIVRVGSNMYDSSLGTKLQKMRLAMKGVA